MAFHTAKDAITFALNLQEELRQAHWKDDILSQPEACECGNNRGLRVRIGIHYGPVTKRTNAVTGRLEYTGATLNRARELEKMALGGQILTTRSTFDTAAMAAQVKDLGDDVVKILCRERKVSSRRPSMGGGSSHSLRSLGSAAVRLSEGRKKRRSSIKKSFSTLGCDQQSIKSKPRVRRTPSRSKSMSEAEAAAQMSKQNYQWS